MMRLLETVSRSPTSQEELLRHRPRSSRDVCEGNCGWWSDRQEVPGRGWSMWNLFRKILGLEAAVEKKFDPPAAQILTSPSWVEAA